MHKLLRLIVPIVIGYLFAYWVVGYELGLGRFLSITLTVVLGFLVLYDNIQKNKFGIVILIATLLIALSSVIYEQTYFEMWDALFLVPLVMFGMFLVLFPETNILTSAKAFVPEWLLMMIGYVTDRRHSWRDIHGWSLWVIQKQTVIGVVWGIIALVVLIPLLSTADAIFGKRVGELGSTIREVVRGIIQIDARILIWIAGTIVAGSTIFYGLYRTVDIKGHNPALIDKHILTIVLGFVTVVYVIFAIIQMVYLFGGSALPAGFTYSTYAVEGFWQLTFVTLCNVLLLLYVPEKITKGWSRYTILLTMMVICSGIIWGAGLYRLLLYIDAYGLTFMRLLPLSFIVYLGYTLIVAFAGLHLWRRNRTSLLFYGLVFWYISLHRIGVDRIIAQYNIDRFLEGRGIDVMYMQELSVDQLLGGKTLWTVEEVLKQQMLKEGRKCEEQMGRENEQDLCRQYNAIQGYKQMIASELSNETPWQAWSYGSWRVKKMLY